MNDENEKPPFQGLRVVSDGTIMGTDIFNASGESVVKGMEIYRVEWSHHAGHLPEMRIFCRSVLLDGKVEVPVVYVAQRPDQEVAAEQ